MLSLPCSCIFRLLHLHGCEDNVRGCKFPQTFFYAPENYSSVLYENAAQLFQSSCKEQRKEGTATIWSSSAKGLVLRCHIATHISPYSITCLACLEKPINNMKTNKEEEVIEEKQKSALRQSGLTVFACILRDSSD